MLRQSNWGPFWLCLEWLGQKLPLHKFGFLIENLCGDKIVGVDVKIIDLLVILSGGCFSFNFPVTFCSMLE